MKMKKTLAMLLLATTLSSNLVFAQSQLNDISSHWAKENIDVLIEKGAINGYEDNTFRPDESMTRAEFTKILVSLLHGEQEIPRTGHWSGHYMRVAFENNYTSQLEFANYEAKITRGEIARMLSRAMKTDPKNIEQLKNQIKDFSQIPVEYQDHIAKVYAAGIITGYQDSTFKYSRTATRAEATTMTLRFLDESKRQIPEVKEIVEEKPVEKENYKSVTELFQREALSDYIVENQGVITYSEGTEFKRVKYVYKIQKSDLPLKIGNYILDDIAGKFEIIGDYKIPYITLEQTVIGDAYKDKWTISKDGDSFYRGLHMNIANKDYSQLRSRNNYQNFTFDLARTPKIDRYGNEVYKTYYGVIVVDGLSDWKTYRGEDAKHLIFNDKETDYAVIVENVFN